MRHFHSRLDVNPWFDARSRPSMAMASPMLQDLTGRGKMNHILRFSHADGVPPDFRDYKV
jgi:hypothetical protein